jgi:hypothetical protein
VIAQKQSLRRMAWGHGAEAIGNIKPGVCMGGCGGRVRKVTPVEDERSG